MVRGSLDVSVELFEDDPADLLIREDAGTSTADESSPCVPVVVWTSSTSLGGGPEFVVRAADVSPVSLSLASPSRHSGMIS